MSTWKLAALSLGFFAGVGGLAWWALDAGTSTPLQSLQDPAQAKEIADAGMLVMRSMKPVEERPVQRAPAHESALARTPEKPIADEVAVRALPPPPDEGNVLSMPQSMLKGGEVMGEPPPSPQDAEERKPPPSSEELYGPVSDYAGQGN